MQFADLLDQGYEFKSSGPQLQPQDIVALEQELGFALPKDHKDFLLHANGAKVKVTKLPRSTSGYATKIYWPKNNDLFPDEEYGIVDYLFDKEEVIAHRDVEYESFLPEDTYIIATSPGTNLYLMGYGDSNYGKIYAFHYEYNNREYNPAGGDGKAYVGFIANSFVEWMLSLDDLIRLEDDGLEQSED